MVSYVQANAGVIVDLNVEGQQTFGAGYDSLIDIEQVRGSGFDDWLAGTDGINELHGMNGDDIMFGRSQNDSLNGGNGDDIIDGGNGNDHINGSFGNDTASYLTALQGVTVDLAIEGWQYTSSWSEWDNLVSIENLIGTFYDDTLRGDNSDNILNAGAGNDLIEARGGDDILIVGLDTDSDTYDGGSGTDLLRFDLMTSDLTIDLLAAANHAVGADIGVNQLYNIENITSGAGDDTVFGNHSANILAGDDGADVLRGFGGADMLLGGEGNDSLRGDGGADTLDGGAGNDTLRGNGGGDTFVFEHGYGHDRVVDFGGNDVLDLTSFGFGSFADVLALANAGRSGLTLSFGRDSLTLDGVSLASFDASDVLI